MSFTQIDDSSDEEENLRTLEARSSRSIDAAKMSADSIDGSVSCRLGGHKRNKLVPHDFPECAIPHTRGVLLVEQREFSFITGIGS